MTSDKTPAEPNDDPTVVDAPDVAAAPNEPAAADTQDGNWEVIYQDPGNPFTAQLVFSAADEPVSWWDLDPVSLRPLLAALNHVHNEQVVAITGAPPTNPTTAAPTDEPDPSDSEPADRSWWRRHKILTFLLIFVAIVVITGFFAGGTQV